MTDQTWEDLQTTLCRKYRVPYAPSPPHLKIGVGKNLRWGLLPINGLRHPPTETTVGWYIWAGENLPQDADFFMPLHVSHLADWCPEAIRFLGLPPGWRFLLAGTYEDVWEDKSLLDV
jgi:hypothetical protein